MKKTYDKEWHDKHKDDENIKQARKQAAKRRYDRLKNDDEFKAKRAECLKKYRTSHPSETLQRRYDTYENDPSFALLDAARARAKKHNVPYALTVDDVRLLLVDVCPVLGIPLQRNKGKGAPSDNSPTLDRIIPSRGYVPGNIIVVSKLANQIKSSATPDQILRVAVFYQDLFRQQETEVVTSNN